MMLVANASIFPNQTHSKAERKHNTAGSAMTQQEFLFKHYFKSRYPDLLLIFATFGHNMKRTFTFVDKALQHVINVIDETAPNTTKVVWFTAASVLTVKGKTSARYCFKHCWTMDQRVEAMNHVLYNALHYRVKSANKPQMYGFLDLYQVSKGIQTFWSPGVVHFTADWYKYIIGYLFHSLKG
jgi:hypothetical protein